VRLNLGRRSRGREVYVHQRVDQYRSLWRLAAGALGAEFSELSDRIWEVRRGGARTRIANDVLQLDDPVTLTVAGDKALCYRLAQQLAIPVPAYRLLARSDVRAAMRLPTELGVPLVIKPRMNTSSGIGVTVGVTSAPGALRAMMLAGLHGAEVIVEPMVAGETCRLLFLGGTFIHAVRRRGVRIPADGRSTLRTLLDREGRDPRGHDRIMQMTLRAQGIALESIPAAGSQLIRFLPDREVATHGLRTVYDEDITAVIARELVDEVQPIVTAVGSEFAGVDIITTKIDETLRQSGGALLEVNTTPALHHHCLGATADPCDVAVRVLRYALDRRGP
jgi:cyanophycin synthetase